MQPNDENTFNPFLDKVRETISRLGPLESFRTLIQENNELILDASNLDNGKTITQARSAIHWGLMGDWAAEMQTQWGYDHPFAVVALGGTGREEMTPCSDTDFAFLFDDQIDEQNRFLVELQRQVINSKEFKQRCGFSGEVMPFNLDDMDGQEGKQLNSFLDMRPVYDPDGLANRFRDRIRESYDPFEHFLHVTKAWRNNWGKLASKHEQLDFFDVKSDGLRAFLAAIWTLAGEEFKHSHEIYEELEDERDLEAYYFLLRIRGIVHLQKGTHSQPRADGSHKEDEIRFDDFMRLGELAGEDADDRAKFELGNELRARFLTNRRRVDQFTWGVIGNELQKGRVIRPNSGIVIGVGGLRDTANNRVGSWEKSRAALSMLVASQHYGVPIDPSELENTFRDAGDWLQCVPELGALFYESKGSLADSLKFLAQIPEAEYRLFPGYDRFEATIDERVLTEQKCLRGALVREKLRALEKDLAEGRLRLEQAINPRDLSLPDFTFSNQVEAALLVDEHLAAIRLALKTKRLPETKEDVAARENEDLPLYERFASGLSGIPLKVYYREEMAACEFSEETVELTEFLIKNRRAFKEIASQDLMDDQQVSRLIRLCDGNESWLRALFVFTGADRTEWESEFHDPARWFKIRELYTKARVKMNPEVELGDPLSQLGFDPNQKELLWDFGKGFFDGIYRNHVTKFAGALFELRESLKLGETTPPHVKSFRIGLSNIIGIAAVDNRGMAASISGVFWKLGVELSQAHMFSASNHGLALDFFHLAPVDPDIKPKESIDLKGEIVRAIYQNRYTSAEDEANLPDVAENITFRETASGLHQLRAETSTEDVSALIYFLTCKAYRRLEANVCGLGAQTSKDKARISVYMRLPDSMSGEEAMQIVESW